MTDVTNPTSNSTNTTYHTDERFELLKSFIDLSLEHQPYTLESLPSDASFRRYHRINIENPIDGYQNTYMIMDAPPELESIESFVRVDKLLAEKINVPTIIAEDLQNGFLILQDFGKTEFAHLLLTYKSSYEAEGLQVNQGIDKLYKLAIDTLIELQSMPVELAQQSYDIADYDEAMLLREVSLFNEWFLPYIDCKLENEDDKAWQHFVKKLSDNIVDQPKVVVHRDYHSRNLMKDQYQPESLGIIDFQDAVIGAYTYDLVSLLRDAYVDWNEEDIQHWIEYYWEKVDGKYASGAKNIDQFITQFNLMGVQRHLKILGIFVRLSERDGKNRYLADIPKVWSDLKIELQWLSDNADDDITSFITPVFNWLTKEVEPKYKLAFLSN